MNSIKLFTLSGAVMVLTATSAFSQKPIFTSSKLKEATVYANGAELRHATSVNLPKGTSELVIKNVANSLDANTIQVLTPKGVTVLSSQFTTNYLSEYSIDETNPIIRVVRDSIQLLEVDLLKLRNEKATSNAMLQILEKNQTVAGENNGLSTAELMKLMDYYRLKRTELNNAIIANDQKITKSQKLLNNLNAKLKTNEDSSEKLSKGVIVLRLLSDIAIAAPIEVNYLTFSASWTPSYELRVDDINKPLNLLYKANVVQNSGLDWKQINLNLSSSIPNQSNAVPYFSPWFLRAGQVAYHDVKMVMNSAVMAKGKSEAFAADYESRSLGSAVQMNESALSLSYTIDILYDIYSNGKNHTVSLKEENIPVSYSYYSAPKLNKDVYLLAEISNYSKYNILPGEANIVFEGMYVGKTFINADQTKDTLSISVGRDKNIVVMKEKVLDKSGTKVFSSQKETTFTYDITVRNNKKTNATIVLKDQIPISTEKDVTVELLQSDKAKLNSEVGTLTWEVELKPNETRKYRISYKVKQPKDMVIGNL